MENLSRQGFSSTQYIQNRRNSSKLNGSSPLQFCNGLIGFKPAIAYFAYTNRYAQGKKSPEPK